MQAHIESVLHADKKEASASKAADDLTFQAFVGCFLVPEL